jgi:AraC-like DNA-binding protein
VLPLAESKRGADSSFIVNEPARTHTWQGKTFLSIKLFEQGEALYETHDGAHRVSSGYLVLNESTSYRVTLRSDHPVKPFVVFFAPGFVERVAAVMNRTERQNLDEPTALEITARRFFERTSHGDALHARLRLFANQISGWREDPLWLSEQMHGLAAALIRQTGEGWSQVSRVSAVRPATKEEIYRRLWKARDWAQAMLDREITLADMANVACMSESYFLRTFRQNFNQTPHQFLMDVRLEKARALLRNTRRSVTDISTSVGFQSLGSFSWLFKNRHNLSPDAYRRAMSELHEIAGFR